MKRLPARFAAFRPPRFVPALPFRVAGAGARPVLRRVLSLLLPCFIATRAVGTAAEPTLSSDRIAQQIKAHASFLADDLLEGRGTGTRGHALAARYVSARFARLGLEPAGDNGAFDQRMRLIESHEDLQAVSITVQGIANPPAFAAMNDVLVRPATGAEHGSVTAAAVFVGFGVHAPELKYDDFGDIDVRGKIVVYLFGAPQKFPANPRAYYSDWVVKAKEFVRRGAVGSVLVLPPREEVRVPWAFWLLQARFPRMRLLDGEGRVVDGFPELKLAAVMNSAAATRLFAASGRKAADIFAAAERGEPQCFPLGFELTLAGQATVRTTDSMNIIARLPGSDERLAGEPIIVTSHLDHIGIGPAIDGDSIYNGAMDNAVGVALMLTIAERLAALPPSPRPVLFAALTAEEKGLLGAEHLVSHLPPGVRRFAANLNLDQVLFPAPVRDLVARGEQHSTLGEVIAAVAAPSGFTLSPDPIPDEVLFIRSDQYPFVKAGVPALFLHTGGRSHDPGVDLPGKVQ